MISNDHIMFQLKDALDTIQVLHQKLNLMTDDLQHVSAWMTLAELESDPLDFFCLVETTNNPRFESRAILEGNGAPKAIRCYIDHESSLYVRSLPFVC